MPLEHVIRPFQSPDVAPPTPPAPPPSSASTAPVRLEVGKGGGLKQLGGSLSITISFYMDQRVKEKKRE
jgi:hypothetical protein